MHQSSPSRSTSRSKQGRSKHSHEEVEDTMSVCPAQGCRATNYLPQEVLLWSGTSSCEVTLNLRASRLLPKPLLNQMPSSVKQLDHPEVPFKAARNPGPKTSPPAPLAALLARQPYRLMHPWLRS
eukprot:364404-Chlamydomonas_euryale.AAC.1